MADRKKKIVKRALRRHFKKMIANKKVRGRNMRKGRGGRHNRKNNGGKNKKLHLKRRWKISPPKVPNCVLPSVAPHPPR